jgi:hypothetical protein
MKPAAIEELFIEKTILRCGELRERNFAEVGLMARVAENIY